MTRYLLFILTSFLLTQNAFSSDLTSRVDCYISPFMTANVGSEVPGVIAETMVERGDYVTKGQVIARLESKVEQATLELRKARVDYIAREHERKKKLFEDKIISSQEIDEAETNFRVAEREYQEALEVVERRIIRSPLDGVVVERYLCRGERVDDKPIFRVAQLDPLNVEIIAPAHFLSSVKIGDRAAILPELPAKGEFVGRVVIVDPVVDAASGTIGIRVELKNPNLSIPAGLKCEANFLGQTGSKGKAKNTRN